MYESKNHLAQAEQLAKQSLWDEAEAFYIAACESAADYFLHWHSDAETIETTVHCYHRLANCLMVQGRSEAALSVCEKIHQMVLKSLGEPVVTQSRLEVLLRVGKKTASELQAMSDNISQLERYQLINEDSLLHCYAQTKAN